MLFLAASTGWLSIAPGHLVLPTLALALPLAAMLERLQSQAIAEAFQAPGIVAAAARGVPERRLIWLHAGRQAAASGARRGRHRRGHAVQRVDRGGDDHRVAGPGRLMFDALASRDLYLVAGCALAGATLVAAGNLLADLLRAAADPGRGARVMTPAAARAMDAHDWAPG